MNEKKEVNGDLYKNCMYCFLALNHSTLNGLPWIYMSVGVVLNILYAASLSSIRWTSPSQRCRWHLTLLLMGMSLYCAYSSSHLLVHASIASFVRLLLFKNHFMFHFFGRTNKNNRLRVIFRLRTLNSEHR